MRRYLLFALLFAPCLAGAAALDPVRGSVEATALVESMFGKGKARVFVTLKADSHARAAIVLDLETPVEEQRRALEAVTRSLGLDLEGGDEAELIPFKPRPGKDDAFTTAEGYREAVGWGVLLAAALGAAGLVAFALSGAAKRVAGAILSRPAAAPAPVSVSVAAPPPQALAVHVPAPPQPAPPPPPPAGPPRRIEVLPKLGEGGHA